VTRPPSIAALQTILPLCGMTLREVVADGVALLREHEPAGGYYGCFSGGKDSTCIKQLAVEAGVRVRWHYNVTTIDPPELVRFIRDVHPDVTFVRAGIGNLIRFAAEVRGFPTRRVRWCCEEYKETLSPPGAVLIMGIRAAESAARAKRWRDVTFHSKSKAWVVSPILRWSTAHVWEFIRDRGLPYCSLYDDGFERLGCIGCPMAGKAGRLREFARWPKVEAAWRMAFQRIWERKAGTTQRNGRLWFGSRYFDGWEEMWSWWVNDEPLPGEPDDCQQGMWQ
jgi:phosphoadenosine phosphosulfate reductase